MNVKAPQQRATWHDAFDAQMALWRWYRSPMGKLYMDDSRDTAVRGVNFRKTRELLSYMYASEVARVIDADPIYVSTGMCDVIEAASDSFNPEPILETDFLTTRGFVYYARPFLIPDRFDNPTTIRGCSWVRLFNSHNKETVDRAQKLMREFDGPLFELEEKMLAEEPDMEPYGISLTIYCDSEVDDSHFDAHEHAARIRELYPGPIPKLVPLHLTPWYYNMTFDGNEEDENGMATGAEWWWRIIQTTLRLMQQRISSKSFATPDRSARRQAHKFGARPDTEVVVVRLRREKGETKEATGESANYSHRFIVNGFWRNQWYPSAEVHRQIWINPYIKGDPNLPLIIRPKRVYQWDR